jgi:hypothetical protein
MARHHWALPRRGAGPPASRTAVTLRHQQIQIILVGNIDLTQTAGHAEVMAPHYNVQRRYVDLLFVASAACPIRTL